MLEIEIFGVYGHFLEKENYIVFINDLFTRSINSGYREAKILQKNEKSIDGQMCFFILKPLKSHMFSGLKNMATVVQENGL